MANLTELEQYDAGVFQIETDTVWVGGPNGEANRQAIALANRTKWLRAQILAVPGLIDAAIAALVDSSPAAMNTLNELAAALSNDPSFATTMTNALAGKQPLDADLTAISALVSAADKLPYATGAGTWALADFTAFARTLLAVADASAARAAIGAASTADVSAAVAAVVSSSPAALDTLNELAAALGNDPNFATTMLNALAGKQPIDADLTAIAALVSAANKLPYATGAGTWALTDFTAFARTLLAVADAAAARTTLGLGDMSTKSISTDFASLLTSDGYQKFPSGMIIQWGQCSSSGPGTFTVTLPTTFPTAFQHVLIGYRDTLSTDGHILQAIPVNNGHFDYRTYYASSNTHSYLAIGY